MSTATETGLKPGDSVHLKSGGPTMTVTDVSAFTGRVWCRWTNDGGEVLDEVFPAACLVAGVSSWGRGPRGRGL